MGNCLPKSPGDLVPTCATCGKAETCAFKSLSPVQQRFWTYTPEEGGRGGGKSWECRKCMLGSSISDRQNVQEKAHQVQLDKAIKDLKAKEKKEKVTSFKPLRSLDEGLNWADTESFKEAVTLTPLTEKKVSAAMVKEMKRKGQASPTRGDGSGGGAVAAEWGAAPVSSEVNIHAEGDLVHAEAVQLWMDGDGTTTGAMPESAREAEAVVQGFAHTAGDILYDIQES
eukprot:CAMPEP_0182869570 /NCGR_PEP_ID=MMETSP0034_2-20130328/10017_1 /TAXON_ID=156128 /ORGANISM="Nephroselmis pyriformis, Strain CCMP717" /LENGTH=226 /DNA_ID=CAMNT_0025002031 /DNA_START=66 /DNA_END=743 /DNA_ORIENTATION=+